MSGVLAKLRPPNVAAPLIAVIALLSVRDVAAVSAQSVPASAPTSASVVTADTMAQFDLLFAADVRAISTPEQAASFANRLIAQTQKKAQGNLALQMLMFDRAYDYAMRAPAGYANAILSARKLMELAPDRRIECLERVVKTQGLITAAALKSNSGPAYKLRANEALLSVRCELGDALMEAAKWKDALAVWQQAHVLAVEIRSDRLDEIAASLKLSQAHEAAVARIAALKEQFAAKPDNQPLAMQLLMIHLGELDDPGAAAVYAVPAGKPDWAPMLQKAQQDPADLDEAQCAEMGDWYRAVADSAPKEGKLFLYLRSRAYYQSFQERHKLADGAAMRVRLALEQVEKELTKYDSSLLPGPDGWIDLLRPGGELGKPAQPLVLKSGYSREVKRLPAAPEGDYQLRVAMALSDTGEAAVFFPTGGVQCVLVISSTGGVLNGADRSAGKGNTGFAWRFDRGATINLLLTVARAQQNVVIRVTLGGQEVLKWEGPPDAVKPDWPATTPECIQFGRHRGTRLTVSLVKLKMTDGRVKLVR